jgi:hypothetical protein
VFVHGIPKPKLTRDAQSEKRGGSATKAQLSTNQANQKIIAGAKHPPPCKKEEFPTTPLAGAFLFYFFKS